MNHLFYDVTNLVEEASPMRLRFRTQDGEHAFNLNQCISWRVLTH